MIIPWKKSQSDIYCLLGCCVTILFFLTGIFLSVRAMFMLSFFAFLLICAIDVSKRSVFGVAFIITLFTFLCGRFFVNWVRNEESLIEGAYINGTGPNDQQLMQTMLVIMISVGVFCLGTRLSTTPKSNLNQQKHTKKKTEKKHKLTQMIEMLFYVTLVFEIVVSCERAVFLLASGASYTDYYLTFFRILPSFVYKVAELNAPAFFAFLATKSSRKKTKYAMFFYCFDKLIVLFSGQRNQFVRAILICICYIILRNKSDENEVWLKKSEKRLMIFALPLGILALQAWGRIRDGLSFSFSGLLSEIANFFIDQGSTSVVIYKGFEYNNQFPEGILYTFSPIISFFKDNVITKLFFSFPTYTQHTVEYALLGNNYGATLTYLYLPGHYLSGIGMGTSYLAESFHDFGWIGIVIVSLIYGMILVFAEKRLTSSNSQIFRDAILLMFVDGILYAPRDQALGFVTYGINLTTILFIALALVLTGTITRRCSYTIICKEGI